MKKNIIKILMIFSFIFILSGCTELLKDEDNKVVIEEETGKRLTANILCQPTEEKTLDLYEKHNINLNSLPECDEFVPSDGGYEGLWTSGLVKPLAWVILKLGLIFKNYGLGVILSTLVIRIIAYPLTKKIAVQSEKMKKVKPEIDKLEKKYKDKKDQESLMQKNQEMMLIYKKNNINPIGGCLFSFIQLPLLFAFIEAINRVPAIFEGKFLGLNLGITPLIAIKNGQYYYIILIILIVGATYFSFKFNSADNAGEQQKQMQGMMKFMIIFIAFVSFSLPTATALYWITSSLFTILQNLIVKRRNLA